MSSETQFEQLSGLPGHISSFAAATSDGQLLHVTLLRVMLYLLLLNRYCDPV